MLQPAVLAILLLAGGCAAGQDSQADRQLTPADFAKPGPEAEPVQAGARTDAETDFEQAADFTAEAEVEPEIEPQGAAENQPPAAAVAAAPPLINEPAEPRIVDAMVGQVNGRAIYARTVFTEIDEQLRTLGQTLPPRQFNKQAQQLIQGRLRQIVFERLILGESERDLHPQEVVGVTMFLKKFREELLRLYGTGAEGRAQVEIVRQTGLTLDEAVEQKRQEIVVQRFLRLKFVPKINVTRKDIERYYREHLDEYNPPPRRSLRLICATSPAAAETIQRRLENGDPFTEIAHDPQLNANNPGKGGLIETTTGVRLTELNEAIKSLEVGQYCDPIMIDGKVWCAYVESIEHRPGTPLREVQLKIETKLRAQQFRRYTQEYESELFETGSYNPLPQMAEKLIEVAVSRYQRLP